MDSSYYCFILSFCLTSVLFHVSLISSQRQQSLSLGYSSVSPESIQIVLHSPDGTFSAGFHHVGTNAYGFAVWYSNTPESPTLVWMANRDQSVNGRNSRLRLQRDGDLVLFNADGTAIWRTSTKGLPVKRAALLNTGNLVLRSSSGQILWQSFDSPTDTLLPGQRFSNNAQLISRMDNLTYKSGYHRFYFNDENYLALIYQGSNLSSKYWPKPWLSAFENGRTTYNISRSAVLDEFGGFNSSDQFTFSASDYGKGPLRRLTMDVDGNLRLYSLDTKRNSWNITWTAVAEQCRVHGLCGPNGVCVYTPEPNCVCPPGFEKLVDSGHGRDRALSFSTIRGTRGYLAPEWTLNLPITAKADVYSFGILLLELVSGREAGKFQVEGSGINFVQWAFQNVKAEGWMETVVDAKLTMRGEMEREVERVLNTALVCVEQDSDRRPSMSELVQMLMAE